MASLGRLIRSQLAASIAAALSSRLPLGDDDAGENRDPTASPLDLGSLTVNVGVVLSSGDLLAGATDADGDTLSITSVTPGVGVEVVGTGPYVITPTVSGPGSLTVVISDGRGGSVTRTVGWNGVEAAPSVPTITSVSGDVVDGGTFSVAGSGLAFAATLASVSGREATSGNVAALRGFVEHGTGPTWQYAADGTAVLNATSSPTEVYFDFPAPARAVYIEYGLQTSNITPPEPWVPGNGYQIKLARAKGILGNDHSVAPLVGAIWDAQNLQCQNFRPGVAATRPGYTTTALANWVTYSHYAKLGDVGANADAQEDYHLPIDSAPATIAGVDAREGRSNDFLGGILPGFFVRAGFTATLKMRNFLFLDGSSRLVVGNNANYAICTRRTTQPLSSHSASAASGTWDLRAFEPADALYLFLLDDNNSATLVEQIRDAGTVDTYDWTTDMRGIRRVTNNGTSLVQLSGGSPDLSGTTYVDYRLAFKLSSYEPFASGSVVTSFICCGAASVYRSTLSLNPATGAVVINGEGNKNHTLGSFAPAVGQDCRWRLRLPTSGVGVPELWDEVSGVRLDNGAALPSGFGVWSPNRYFKGSTVGIAGDMYHIEAVSDLGTIYELRLTEQVGTDLYSHHNNAVMATIVRANATLINWWQP
ncbi:MAG: cadherin-like domain-containing protein [Gammaproteobacteria bacterium]|nr:cadherin-like domain-containing protein [Gammaproteobacteria bacterium]